MSEGSKLLKPAFSFQSKSDVVLKEQFDKLKLVQTKTVKDHDDPPPATSLKIGLDMVKKESLDSKKTFNNVSSSEDEDFSDDSDFFSDDDYDDEDSVYDMSVDPSQDNSDQQKENTMRQKGHD